MEDLENKHYLVLISAGRVRVRRKQHEGMDPSLRVCGGYILGTLWALQYRLSIVLNAAAYLRVVVDHAGPSTDGSFQQDYHKAQIISTHDGEPAVVQQPPQTPDLRPVEILLMECDAIISIWTKTSEECFQLLE